MKVVFVNRFFYPDLSPTGLYAADVAFDLAGTGLDVHVVTSRLAYDGAGSAYPSQEEIRGVHVHRVWTSRFGRGTLLGRACDYATFYLAAGWRLLRFLSRGDVVVAKTDPPLISVVAAFAAWIRKARLVNWLQDLFPEVAVRAGMRPLQGPVGELARALRDLSLRRAAANVVIGERMAETLRAIPGVSRLHVVPNWTDGALLDGPAGRALELRRQWGLGEKFVVGYCGNLGRVHDCETFLGAARLLAVETDIVFSFVGGGYRFQELKDAGLPNVVVRGYVPEAQLADSLSACDVHLISLKPEFEGLLVPSKFYGTAAVGRPVIFVGDLDGEISRILHRFRCGVAVRQGDAVGLASAIRDLRASPEKVGVMGSRARTAFEGEWDKRLALGRWRQIFSSLGAPPLSWGEIDEKST